MSATRNRGDALLIVLIALGVVLSAVLIWAEFQGASEWAKFRELRNCKVVARLHGDMTVAPIIGGNGGVAISSTPSKTGWLCDDGITYYR